MKIEDYKAEDIPTVIELKKAALHQVEQIEKAIFTDDINEATARISQLYLTMQRVREKKNAKHDEGNMRFLMDELRKNGVTVSIVSMKKPK